VFTLAGLGTIATGCVHDGEARVGERLVVMPSGRTARLRAIQSGGADVEAARAGQRCALALAGLEARDLARGDWVVAAGFPEPVTELHARVVVLPGAPRPLPDLARLHLHLGTDATVARVRTASHRPIEPGGSAICRLQFERPVSALNGDRFILREPSARRTVGGGRVLAASAGARDPTWSADTLALLASHDLGTALDGLLARPAGELELDRLQQAFGVPRDALLRLAAARGAVPAGADARVAVSVAALDALKARLLERLAAFHREDPEAAGPSPLRLAREAGGPSSRAVFAHALRTLGDEGALRWRGPTVALPGHVPPVRRRDAELWERVLPRLAESTASPPSVRVLAADIGVPADELAALLHRKCRDGEAWRITDARFCPRASAAALAVTAAEVAAAQPDGWFRAADFRDRIGTGRGLAIEILEFFDRVGVTLRRGDLRRIRPGYELVLGPGTPLPARASVPALAPRGVPGGD
jgi:selenocysteine-specific elongation factor